VTVAPDAATITTEHSAPSCAIHGAGARPALAPWLLLLALSLARLRRRR
jgi:hypothetical protein